MFCDKSYQLALNKLCCMVNNMGHKRALGSTQYFKKCLGLFLNNLKVHLDITFQETQAEPESKPVRTRCIGV